MAGAFCEASLDSLTGRSSSRRKKLSDPAFDLRFAPTGEEGFVSRTAPQNASEKAHRNSQQFRVVQRHKLSAEYV